MQIGFAGPCRNSIIVKKTPNMRRAEGFCARTLRRNPVTSTVRDACLRAMAGCSGARSAPVFDICLARACQSNAHIGDTP